MGVSAQQGHGSTEVFLMGRVSAYDNGRVCVRAYGRACTCVSGCVCERVRVSDKQEHGSTDLGVIALISS